MGGKRNPTFSSTANTASSQCRSFAAVVHLSFSPLVISLSSAVVTYSVRTRCTVPPFLMRIRYSSPFARALTRLLHHTKKPLKNKCSRETHGHTSFYCAALCRCFVLYKLKVCGNTAVKQIYRRPYSSSVCSLRVLCLW